MSRGMQPETAEKLRIEKGIGKGSKLRRLRVKEGYSQSELANLANVPVKTLQRFEQKTDQINGAKLNTICDLCLALNCKIEDVIEDKDLIKKVYLCK